MRRKLIWALVCLGAGLAVFVAFAFLSETPRGPVDGVPLVRAQSSVPFLEQEAGIVAYAKVAEGIDLQLAKEAYVQVEQETTDFLIGWVSPRQDVKSQFNVRVYTRRDGWVFAYYLRGEATSKIIDWGGYKDGVVLTFLEQALVRVVSLSGPPVKNISNYHYGYPDANTLVVIVGERGKPFSFTVPVGVPLAETSWSLHGISPSNILTRTTLRVSETEIAGTKTGTVYGELGIPVPRGVPVEAQIVHVSAATDEIGAIALLYTR